MRVPVSTLSSYFQGFKKGAMRILYGVPQGYFDDATELFGVRGFQGLGFRFSFQDLGLRVLKCVGK